MAKKEPSKKYIAAREKLMKGVRTQEDFLDLIKNKCRADEEPEVAQILDIVEEHVEDKYLKRRLIDLVRGREDYYKGLIKKQRMVIKTRCIEIAQLMQDVAAERSEKGVLVGTIEVLQNEILKKNETIARLNEYNRNDIIDIEDEVNRAELLDFEEGAPIVQDLVDPDDDDYEDDGSEDDWNISEDLDL